MQSLVQGTPARHHRAERERRVAAGFPPGHPVFRVIGGRDLRAGIDATAPEQILETSLGDETVCLVTVRPEAMPEFELSHWICVAAMDVRPPAELTL